jgi:predicted dehydrogenase/threonine dehydrogenase-like Zn-dependent dehydrogenase
MKQVLVGGGKAWAAEVPAPQVSPGSVLVRVERSCISVGTELAGLRMSALPLYQRARRQPENVKRVLAMIQEQGLATTLERVRGKLSAGSATGYSAAGCVVAVGSDVEGFALGERVACAGAGIANHAEFIDVPVNLAVRVPEAVTMAHACTVTLGAIALQGVRRTAPTLGETVVVVGLGILGQLTVQMLAANGCRVVGVDVDAARIELARANGLHEGIDASSENYVARIGLLTAGFGADAVVVTAASASNDIINEAMRAARKKGRIVLVGDVGLALNRADLYPKELDFLVSTSYGPGRYDPHYEEGGNDYPLAYVRWTENRNMQAYIGLLAEGKVKLDNLISESFEVDRAGEAYAALQGEGTRPMMVLLDYPRRADPAQRKVALPSPRVAPRAGALRVGLVGASSFAQGMHLPNMQRLRDRFTLHAVMSRTGANARAVGQQHGARYCTSDLDELLADADIDLVMITTRHDQHGSAVLRALQAGKHVFVEKPLTLDATDLDRIESFYRERPDGPLLMVGYNRRFAPAVTYLRAALQRRSTPLIVNYRMNAGFIASDHWVHGPEGGGRNLGEACHVYDLFAALVGDVPDRSVHAVAAQPANERWARNDNFVATISYSDGSACSLTYTALGDKSHPKERMDVYADGCVFTLDDYKSASVAGGRNLKPWSSSSPQKGQFEELVALSDALRGAAPWPIDLVSLLRTSRISFEVEQQINQQPESHSRLASSTPAFSNPEIEPGR